MKTILVEPYNDRRYYNNNLFNDKIDINLRFFKDVRENLKKEKINFATIDTENPANADKLVFFDFSKHVVKHTITKLKSKEVFKKKAILIINENSIIKKYNWNKKNHEYFSKIFTWDDTLVDNKKYFKYHIPQASQAYKTPLVPFARKKLLVLINAYKLAFARDELYSMRIEAIRFFEKVHPKGFDLYGKGWDKPLQLKYAYYLKDNPLGVYLFVKEYIHGKKGFLSYKGMVPDEKKLSTMAQYKFALCFENMTGIDGYITEKIFDCFKANCVPIYWGAKNVQKYIPHNTFIDFREFMSYEKLYKHIVNMSEKEYNEYIKNIRKFMNNGFKKWLPEYFINNVLLR